MAIFVVRPSLTVLAGIDPDFLMDSEPELSVPAPVEDFNPAMASLWMEALKRPEADMQRMAAETIARAHQFGVPDLAAAVPRLEQVLLDDASHRVVRFAAARALIVLESRGSSDVLFEVSQAHGGELRQLIEPALAAWDNASARELWLKRLKEPGTRSRELILAVRGLGQVQESSALPDLVSIAADRRRSPVLRMEAALAAGRVTDSGLEEDGSLLARRSQSDFSIDQLCAVRLLVRHDSEAAQQLLIDLANDEESVVVAAALQRLSEIDISLLLPLVDSAVHSPDATVRRHGVTCMLQRPAARHVTVLSELLADPHPGLRSDVCEGLFELAQDPTLDAPIRDAGMQVLNSDSWEGQEQAALLLGSLGFAPAADRLVELLQSPRMEVTIAAGWALSRVAVAKTIPALIDHAKLQTERRWQKDEPPGLDEQVAHVFEAIGVLKAEPAMPLLLRYVPKQRTMPLSRSAAVWAIGQLRDGTRDAEVEAALDGRINDFSPQPDEQQKVKEMAAVALGRMQAVEYAPMMRQLALAEDDDIELRLELALGWAVEKLTGEELPPPQPTTLGQGRWFLEPVAN